MGLVLVKTFDNSIDAHILIAKLESEDIKCYLVDENIMSVNPLFNIAVGGIKVKINEKDVEKVRTILSDIETVPYTNEQDEVISCPVCASTELDSGWLSSKGLMGFFISAISLILTVFPFYKKKVYRCKSCDAEF
jgi:hypothetical protein